MNNLNKYIDHTLLKADAITSEIQDLCFQAVEHEFYSVCVNTSFVGLAKAMIKDNPVKIAATVGFPLGACSTDSKAFEANKALEDGADEIDVVMNIGAFKENDFEYVAQDIATVVAICKNHNAVVKVIIETCLLTKDQIIKASDLVVSCGADYVKTSTGFSTGGATVEDVKLMAETVGTRGKVKASGGIKTREDAIKMIEAGASRLGCSSSIEIVTGN